MPLASEYRDKGGSSKSIEAEGTYLLSPGYVDTSATTKKGNSMVKVCWEDEGGAGSVWDNLVLSDDTPFCHKRFGALWFAFGEEDQDFPTLNDIANACVLKLNAGVRVYAKVKMEPYQGELGPKIDCYLSPEEGETIVGQAPSPGPSEAPF